MIVRLTDAWTEVLQRRAQQATGAYPAPVQELLGEMAAAGVLMQSNIKFNGALVLQVFGTARSSWRWPRCSRTSACAPPPPSTATSLPMPG
jgi:redox-regulated HSP33 family molecular chaperone